MTTMPAPRNHVFISYSHRDREWLDRLNVHLRPLVREDALVVWDDSRIAPGSEWRSEIQEALASAKVAVLLVSADYLASDFVASHEIPPLLEAAKNDGAIIMPLILSPSRFSRTPELARFQSVNDPAQSLIAMSRAQQEEVLVSLADAIERAMGSPQGTAVVIGDGSGEDVRGAALSDWLPIRECLPRLGCREDFLDKEEAFITTWINRRVGETLWRSEGPNVVGYLTELGEDDRVAAAVGEFVDHIVAFCAPAHGLLNETYVSSKKVSSVYRLLRSEIDARHPLGQGDSVEDKLVRIHHHLLTTNRLIFVPGRLLLDGDLPTRADEICYFSGKFRLNVDEDEMKRVPGAAEALASKEGTSMYGVVSNVFKNPDPFAYPLLSWDGRVGEHPVTMVLSRKYIRFSSSTASFLARALIERSLEIKGIGTITESAGAHEVHPLACSGTY